MTTDTGGPGCDPRLMGTSSERLGDSFGGWGFAPSSYSSNSSFSSLLPGLEDVREEQDEDVLGVMGPINGEEAKPVVEVENMTSLSD